MAEFHSESAPHMRVAAHNSETTETIVVTDYLDPLAAAAGSPTTAEGIGVGSTRSELLAAHTNLSKSSAFPGFANYTMSNGDGRWIHFETSTDGAEYVVRIVVNVYDTAPSELCG
ncbi:MAG TPA: hypothetical protein VEX88_00030 [Glaciibacter sp.]|nr:hypothetical protein [Glaciibacter sp.]